MRPLYIQNLHRNEVSICRALFDAAAKTEEGIKRRKLAMMSFRPPEGIWSPVPDYQIEAELRTAKTQRHGIVREIGYLEFNLLFDLHTVSTVGIDIGDQFETIYGISVKEVLTKAGFTCSDHPIAEFVPTAHSSKEIKSEQSTQTSTARVTYIMRKNVDDDKRFTKSTQPGMLYQTASTFEIEDEVLEGYGFIREQWERPEKKPKDPYHIVFIKKLNDNVSHNTADVENAESINLNKKNLVN